MADKPKPPTVVVPMAAFQKAPSTTPSAMPMTRDAMIAAEAARNERFARAQFYAPAARYTGLAAQYHAQAAAEDQGPIGNFLDDWWMDDFRGTVPFIGPAVGMATDAYNWTVEHRNQIASYGLSVLPGGVQTFDWDQAAAISPGRVWVAMGVQEGDYDAYRAEYAAKHHGDKATRVGLRAIGAPQMVNDAPTFVPVGWDIRNPEDEKWLFGDPENPDAAISPQSTNANLASGTLDAAITWFLDPLVVAGKGIKVFRFGTSALGMDIVGQTVRNTDSVRALKQIEAEADDFIQNGVVRGMARDGVNLAQRPGSQLQNELWAVGPYKDDILDIADQIHEDDLGVIFLAAAAGSKKYIGILHERGAAIADAMTSLRRANPYEFAGLNAPIGANKPAILRDLLETNVTGAGLLDDLIARDQGLQAALGLLDEAYSPIQQIGGRFTSKAGMSWRAGKTERGMVNHLFGPKRTGQLGPDERPKTGGYDVREPDQVPIYHNGTLDEFQYPPPRTNSPGNIQGPGLYTHTDPKIVAQHVAEREMGGSYDPARTTQSWNIPKSIITERTLAMNDEVETVPGLAERLHANMEAAYVARFGESSGIGPSSRHNFFSVREDLVLAYERAARKAKGVGTHTTQSELDDINFEAQMLWNDAVKSEGYIGTRMTGNRGGESIMWLDDPRKYVEEFSATSSRPVQGFDEAWAGDDAEKVAQARFQASVGEPAWEGGPVIYHGTPSRLPGDQLLPDSRVARSDDSILGGLSGTSNSAVARQFANTPRTADDVSPAVYSLTWKGDKAPGVINLNDRAPDFIKATAQRIMDGTAGLPKRTSINVVAPAGKGLMHDVVVTHLGHEIGRITWNARTGRIRKVVIDPQFDKTAVGEAAYKKALAYAEKKGITAPVHSDDLGAPGPWAASVMDGTSASFPKTSKAIAGRSSTMTVLKALKADMEALGRQPWEIQAALKSMSRSMQSKGFHVAQHGRDDKMTHTFLSTRKVGVTYHPNAGTELRTGAEILQDEMMPLVRAFTPDRLRTIDPQGSTPAVFEQVFQLSKNFRKVAVWEWASGQRGSGWLTVRGMEDGYASEEWTAALRDSKALRKYPDFLRALVESWTHGVSETANLQRVVDIESAAVVQMAKHYGISETLAMKLYKNIDRKRMDVIDVFRNSKGRAYGVDPESGKYVVAGPKMRSQLDTKVPLIDFRQMDKIMASLAEPHMKPFLGELEDALLRQLGADSVAYHTMSQNLSHVVLQTLDGINSMWKAAVLLRLGYTQRNVFEGWLRTWAVLGMVPALAPANIVSGVPRMIYNAKAGKRLSRIEGTQKELSKIIEQNRSMLTALEDRAATLRARTIPVPDDLRVSYYRSHAFYEESMGGGGKWIVDRKRGLRYTTKKDGTPFRDEDYPDTWPPQQDGVFNAIVDREDLPDFVYHVTTRTQAVAQDGALRMSKGEGGGLGGPASMHNVSFTARREDAVQVRDDIRLYLSIQSSIASGHSSIDEVTTILADDFARYGGDVSKDTFTGLLGRMRESVNKGKSPESVWSDHANEYFNMRQYQTTMKPEQPGFYQQSALAGVDPMDVNIIAIPKKNIPDDVLIEDVGYRRMGEHSEVRVFGDVPLGQRQLRPVKDAVVYDDVLAGVEQEMASIQAVLDDYMGVMSSLSEKRGKIVRKFIGADEAFHGPMGEIRRANASNMQTVKNFFESSAARDAQISRLDDQNWMQRPMTPDDPQYFDELSGAAIQFRSDPLGQLAIRMDGGDGSVEHMMEWFKTDLGRKYARDMALFDEADQLARAKFLAGEANNYFPGEAMALANQAGKPALGSEFRAALGGRADLKPIHGRELRDHMPQEDPYHKFINWAFKWLGSKPDSALVRQPFYNEVWKRNMSALYEKARAQGDILDDQMIVKIEETAHRRALKAVNDTLFTIERYSNPAAALRFLSPFFAAWENSIRTWSRIILRDPSVAARASILWDMPNNLGMVVDENGTPVKTNVGDFLSGSVNQYIVLPKPMADFFTQFSGGVPFKVLKGALNVVAPGATPFLPGFGPLVTAPVGNILASKPDMQEFWKGFLGEAAYSQFAPFGQASGDLWDTVAPPTARKLFQLWQGEGNQDYMAVLDAVTVDALVEWRLSGGDPADRPDPAAIKETTDDFYLFSAIASATFPVSITRISRYQPQLDAWRQLGEDPTLTYREKVALFLDKWGDSFVPLTRSTSKSDIQGLDPTMEMFKGMTEHETEVAMLTSRIGPDGASIIAATIPEGKFNAGVWSYWTSQRQPGEDSPWKRKMTPEEIMTEDAISSMWTEYTKEKTLRDQALAAYGIKTWDSAAARDLGITEMWENFQDSMHRKYGVDYTVHGPDAFTKKIPATISGLQLMVDDKEFMASELGQSAVWQAIDVYMKERRMAQDAIELGADPATVKELFAEFAGVHKYASLKFADFYDTFLDGDDLGIRLESAQDGYATAR